MRCTCVSLRVQYHITIMPARTTRRYRTLAEVIEAVTADDSSDSDNEILDVCILPPKDGAESETEDIGDDLLATEEPGDVAGELEVFARSGTDESHDSSEVEVAATSSKPTASKKQKQPPTKKAKMSVNDRERGLTQPKWKKSDTFFEPMTATVPTPLADSHPELIAMSPIELFDTIFTQQMLEDLRQQFELYANRDSNFPGFSATVDDIRHFMGILLLSGYYCLPCERDYWSTADDLGCSLAMKTMSRSKFQELKRFCHIADNQALASSRVAKVKPLYDGLNKSLMQFGVFDNKLSIDESMVPYYGHHGAKMFIRGKPIRFGYKIWMLCSADGYPYQAIIYCGKADRPEHVGLGEHVVTSLAHCIANKEQHKLYFDNFFTSYSLLSKLRDDGVKATGTVRDGRLGGASLPDKKEFRKMPRGSYEHVSDGRVTIVRWSDNNLVTCASNFDHVFPVKTVQRRIAGNADKVPVSQPLMIANYIRGMGGVDLMDRLLSAYRPRIKGKKWWWNLFVNALNIAVVAAWKLHCRAHLPSEALSHLSFRREVVHGLTLAVSRQRQGGPTAPVSQCVRYDGMEHYLTSATQGRCAFCGSNTRKMCSKCEKRLHELCFPLFHKP